jgi:hypothetical protein
LVIALVITSRRVIARASRHTRRSMFCIQRPYRSQRTCLNVYAPDISNVYDTPIRSAWRWPEEVL